MGTNSPASQIHSGSLFALLKTTLNVASFEPHLGAITWVHVIEQGEPLGKDLLSWLLVPSLGGDACPEPAPSPHPCQDADPQMEPSNIPFPPREAHVAPCCVQRSPLAPFPPSVQQGKQRAEEFGVFFFLLYGLKSSSVINASELQLGRYIASECEGLGSVVKRGLSRAPAMFPIM